MHFTRLRLNGFKSFVEPTELVVQPGLTGIVGPNGCGKSNLVEALKWVMGENSPKRMRGGEMDDVIFAGTSVRPARNVAEVSLALDNSDRSAPAAFNEGDEIEVIRRIERESGSAYSVNGNDVRARDVQLLFADLSTGAHSTAMVSQGQISQMIAAKPEERRVLLEEAAGISGLHSRRHEAELRLRAAEQNLERLAEVMAGHDTQLRALKRQARQASRYTKLSAELRAADAQLLLRLWTDALIEAEAATIALREAEELVATATSAAAIASTAQAEAALAVPPLRQAEAEVAAGLQRLRMEREALDAEEGRARAEAERLQARIVQIDTDCKREEALGTDAAAHLTALEQEQTAIAAARAGEDTALQDARAAAGAVKAELAEAEAAADRANEIHTQTETRRATLAAEAQRDNQRVRDLESRAADVAAERARLQAEADAKAAELLPNADGTGSAEDQVPAIVAARTESATAAEALAAAERTRAQANGALSAAREASHEAETRHRRVAAEASALGDVLSVNQDSLFAPVLDAIAVDSGYEAALAAALGDDLAASTDASAPAHWNDIARAAGPALPAGCEPLAAHVRAPAALAHRLSQIGVVAAEQGFELQASLAQGQRLVTREGKLWRWDGLTAAPDSGASAAVRLRQRNRLAELQAQLDPRKAEADAARAATETARAATAAAEQAENAARIRVRDADHALARAREAHARAVREAVARNERLIALAGATERLAGEIAELRSRAGEAARLLAELPEATVLRAEIAAARERLDALRRAHAEADRTLARLLDEQRARNQRLAAVANETGAWATRMTAAEAQIERLVQRRSADEADLAVVAAKPAVIATQRAALVERIDATEAERSAAADALAQAETVLAARDRDAKQTQAAASDAREHRVRAESRVQQSEERGRGLIERMTADLDCRPEGLRALTGLADQDQVPAAETMTTQIERLKRERDSIGPVNLRAEAEAAELEAEVLRLTTERDDLEGAIRKLRAAIGTLNREGRERMLAAFETVDRHFRELFGRLFGGGEAHLKLVDSEDPLEAGLEIMASPPGKRLQKLTLLSGGEQALTAVALRFAVFLTNPAPICVMDEVDAPLDDANVERFCMLLSELSRRTGTRFLIITHHPQTMTHMDRLFGVTMAERGVSQLVSVDLARAEALRNEVIAAE